MVVEYGESVHTELETVPGQPGPAGETTDLIRSMALSSAELWHDVLQRLAELQESQVVLAHAIAELGTMVRDSLPGSRAAELEAPAAGALPAGRGVDLPPQVWALVDLPSSALETDEHVEEPVGEHVEEPESSWSPPTVDTAAESEIPALVEPSAEAVEVVEDLEVPAVDEEPAVASVLWDPPRAVTGEPGHEDESQPPNRRRRRFLRRAHAGRRAETVPAMASEADDEQTEEPVSATVHPVVDEDYPPLPPPPVDETWEPVAVVAEAPALLPPLLPPPAFEIMVPPPPPAPVAETVPPAREALAPPQTVEPVPALTDEEPGDEPALPPPTQFSMPAPPAPFATYEPPADPAPFSMPVPPAPFATYEPPAATAPAVPDAPDDSATPAPPAPIVYVPSTAETAMLPPEAPASFPLDPPPPASGAELEVPPLPAPPVAEEAGAEEPDEATAGTEPALVGATAGRSHSSASMATEILASTPAAGRAEQGPDQPSVLMVSEDLTLVNKSRKRRLQFRLR